MRLFPSEVCCHAAVLVLLLCPTLAAGCGRVVQRHGNERRVWRCALLCSYPGWPQQQHHILHTGNIRTVTRCTPCPASHPPSQIITAPLYMLVFLWVQRNEPAAALVQPPSPSHTSHLSPLTHVSIALACVFLTLMLQAEISLTLSLQNPTEVAGQASTSDAHNRSLSERLLPVQGVTHLPHNHFCCARLLFLLRGA
jgi:hypothetical protein